LNGGYLALGVAEAEGRAVLPPRGLSEPDQHAAAKWVRGACNRLDPSCRPVAGELAEARLTGLDKIHDAMARNGSSPPRFEFDEGRTCFTAALPAHRTHCAGANGMPPA